MLLRLRSQGITILASTPYMDEAALCDRIALIQGVGLEYVWSEFLILVGMAMVAVVASLRLFKVRLQ